ncbi:MULTISPECIES: 2-amino-4-hydroxy-6-hydroxymethyldihydropteridine diphosphokinase [unclassified Meiothermus]|uniref:2-amino-4-hydroxy-6- hydroxymethyldihydropteridine diphosphokinase n=1 Tax=unclassified Meiothermus TaxID=370471 RepID=UPI000D7CE4B3|nr:MULTISPECIES: 2-amino-4-hydroxy-6-hydroxymethyldihydropteridine diphosphokinase [unclassified Meiothermus]PZA05903.1 2-amino-4-hydroxy-6-hydroxymethyldihydropteridine diphosphokinase [Meiothermus sp. Pnk-1]RYM32021.1 2-amino-4-hydroxy-6-hydroxymethyldihydropteridine diphosphokinase [Meiothermus sp. PNK-Is4]
MKAYIALGSNLGDRAGYLLLALSRLSHLPRTRLSRLSQVYQTDPVGPPGQGPYLNMVAEVEAGLEPQALLQALLEIEKSLGRERTARWGPRTLDLDLLLYGQEVIETPGLILPHPRLHERAFVLAPLCDLIPEARHPSLGMTYREWLERVDSKGVRVWEKPL